MDMIKSIISDKQDDKPEKKSRMLAWISSASSSMAARGLYEAIPKIINYVQQLV